jgi:Transposase DDE domain
LSLQIRSNRDSTAIPARERFAVTAEHKKQRQEKKREKQKQRELKQKALRTKTAIPRKKRVRKGSFDKKKAAERGSRIQRQRKQTVEQMLSELPTQCDIGTKINSQGNNDSWRGYKIHLDTADGQMIIAAVLTSASVHDSQVAIPLMTLSSQRVDYLYELSDSAYDAQQIDAQSRQLGHVPITALHGRRASKKATPPFPVGTMPQLTPAQEERFKGRTMSERVNARLKDEFGGNTLRVRGAKKVMAHLMFGVLAITVDQWLRLSALG